MFTSLRRDGWFDIPEIAARYRKLQEDVNKPGYNAAKDSLAPLKFTDNRLVFS